MGGSFESDDRHADQSLRPIRVPARREDIYGEAKDMVADLAGWELVREDAAAGLLVCRRAGGFLRGEAVITIRVEGPEGIPSSTVLVRSETRGGLLPRDRRNVQEFSRPFHRRVC
jgi:hypothetical protein